MACPTPSNTDILCIQIGEQTPPQPIITLLGLDVFLELCLVVKSHSGSPIPLTPEQLAAVTQLLTLVQQILIGIENL